MGAGFFLGVVGMAQRPEALGASLFLEMFVLAFANAPFWSMLQAKVAPDVQGRVFAAYLQVILLMAPLDFLIAGPLADKVFEPARRLPGWRSVAWLVGAGPGAGMGLMFVVAGVLILAFSLAAYAVPAVRRLETDLPDHTVVVEQADWRGLPHHPLSPRLSQAWCPRAGQHAWSWIVAGRDRNLAAASRPATQALAGPPGVVGSQRKLSRSE